MGLARSTFYDLPAQPADEASIVAAILAVCEEFVFYGYRRVGAALRQKGLIVNHKRIRRLMRQHGLQPSKSRRFAVTTNSNHDGPVFPNLARDMSLTGPNQLWASDITYIALPDRFVYVAIIQDAWSRLIAGYAVGRSIDKRLAIAALLSAIARRKPPQGLGPSFRPRLTIRIACLLRYAQPQRHDRLHGPQGQSLRQRQSRELHEDA
ncbi:MAG: IS3 family transposase [Rhizobiaceae bacterium]